MVMFFFKEFNLSTGRLCAVRQDTSVVEDLLHIQNVNYNILSRERVGRRNNLQVMCMFPVKHILLLLEGLTYGYMLKTGVNF